MAMELQRADRVVVQRPDGAVAEPVVVILDLVVAQRHRMVGDALDIEGLFGPAGAAVPSHPDPSPLSEHRGQGGDQAARAGRPFAGFPVPGDR